MTQEFFSVADLSTRWDVNRLTVHKWIRCQILRAYRFPGVGSRGMYRVAKSEMERFERDQCLKGSRPID